jgi:NADH:ubiquinone oxidoreductase subunit D
LDYGLTGVMSRSVGIKRDLRLDKLETYANYYFLNFRSFLGQNGDSYDRYLIRMSEMAESLNIVNQIIYNLLKYNKIKDTIKSKNILKYVNKRYLNSQINKNQYNKMEDLIKHFKY